jgi:hypothetical protein
MFSLIFCVYVVFFLPNQISVWFSFPLQFAISPLSNFLWLRLFASFLPRFCFIRMVDFRSLFSALCVCDSVFLSLLSQFSLNQMKFSVVEINENTDTQSREQWISNQAIKQRDRSTSKQSKDALHVFFFLFLFSLRFFLEITGQIFVPLIALFSVTILITNSPELQLNHSCMSWLVCIVSL